MNLPDARDFLRRRLKSGNDTSRYAAADLDDAIYTACNDFVNETHCTQTLSTVAITANTEAVDFSSLSALFRPGMIRSVTIVADSNYSAADVTQPLALVSPADIKRERGRCGTTSGVPRWIAFPSHLAARLYPPPKANGSLEVAWAPAFSSWTLGVGQATAVLSGTGLASVTVNHGGGRYSTAPAVTFSGGGGSGAAATATLDSNGAIASFGSITAGTGYTSAPTVLLDGADASVVTLNVPQDLLLPVLVYAAVVVQWNEVEAVERDLKVAAYKAHVAMSKGMGGFEAKEIPAPLIDTR